MVRADIEALLRKDPATAFAYKLGDRDMQPTPVYLFRPPHGFGWSSKAGGYVLDWKTKAWAAAVPSATPGRWVPQLVRSCELMLLDDAEAVCASRRRVEEARRVDHARAHVVAGALRARLPSVRVSGPGTVTLSVADAERLLELLPAREPKSPAM